MNPIFDRKQMRKDLHRYLKQAETYRDLTRQKCAEFIGCSSSWLRVILKGDDEWSRLKDEWVRKRLLKIMKDVYRNSKCREQFTIVRIREQTDMMGSAHSSDLCMSEGFFYRLIGDKWREMAATLPTLREVVLLKLEEMVQANVPFAELSGKMVVEAAGFRTKTYGKWLMKSLREARAKLEKQQQDRVDECLSDQEIRLSPDTLICLSDDQWNLRSVNGSLLERNKLRADLAHIAWAILREELRDGYLSPNSISNHYYAFVQAGHVLGTNVPNINNATLEAVQYAWTKYKFKVMASGQKLIRQALIKLFSSLVDSSADTSAINKVEMLRIVCWLNTIKLSQNKPDEYFLSQEEMEKVINGCLVDIVQGLAFINDHPDWINMTTLRYAKLNASPVVDWTIALIILLMSVTGLRFQSLVEIELGKWVQIYPDVFALAYRHGKVKDEKVVAVPGLVIKALEQYSQATDMIRQGLPIKRLFLNGNTHGFWCIFKDSSDLIPRLDKFVERHGIKRNGTPININPMVMRRTYATRELYEGRNLNVIRIQLGHISQTTTEHYTKFERFEHPAHVRDALDRYGRLALTTWKNPVLLEDLSSAERQMILSNRTSRDQDIGLCRHEHCVKVQQGGTPPCSLCELLATGPEFLGAWQAEHEERLAEIKGLSKEPGDAHRFAEKQYQLRRFEANLAYVKQRIVE